VIDVNDPPTSISLVSKGIYENATAGAVVGVLQAQDEDANQSHYYQVIYSQGMFRSCLHFCHHSMPFFPTEASLLLFCFQNTPSHIMRRLGLSCYQAPDRVIGFHLPLEGEV